MCTQVSAKATKKKPKLHLAACVCAGCCHSVLACIILHELGARKALAGAAHGCNISTGRGLLSIGEKNSGSNSKGEQRMPHEFYYSGRVRVDKQRNWHGSRHAECGLCTTLRVTTQHHTVANPPAPHSSHLAADGLARWPRLAHRWVELRHVAAGEVLAGRRHREEVSACLGAGAAGRLAWLFGLVFGWVKLTEGSAVKGLARLADWAHLSACERL